jgi:hypothetical protein
MLQLTDWLSVLATEAVKLQLLPRFMSKESGEIVTDRGFGVEGEP